MSVASIFTAPSAYRTGEPEYCGGLQEQELHAGGGCFFDDEELELLELALGVEELDELDELDEVIDEELRELLELDDELRALLDVLECDDVIELLDIELRELLDSELPELLELLERELEVERLDLELLELLGNVFELVELLDLELTLRELRELLDRELRELLDFDDELRELGVWELLDWELWKPLVDDELFEELEELDITGLPNYEGPANRFIILLRR